MEPRVAAFQARHSPCRGDYCGARNDRAFRQRVVKLRIGSRALRPLAHRAHPHRPGGWSGIWGVLKQWVRAALGNTRAVATQRRLGASVHGRMRLRRATHLVLCVACFASSALRGAAISNGGRTKGSPAGIPALESIVVLDDFLEQAEVDGFLDQLHHLGTHRSSSRGACNFRDREHNCIVNASESVVSRMRASVDAALYICTNPHQTGSHRQQGMPARVAYGPEAEHRDHAWEHGRLPSDASRLGLRETNQTFREENAYTILVYLGGDGSLLLGSGANAREVEVVPGRLVAFPNQRLVHSAVGSMRQLLGPVAYFPGKHNVPLWPTGINACGNGDHDISDKNSPIAGEECDDGNSVSGDGCSSDCKVEVCAAPAWVVPNYDTVALQTVLGTQHSCDSVCASRGMACMQSELDDLEDAYVDDTSWISTMQQYFGRAGIACQTIKMTQTNPELGGHPHKHSTGNNCHANRPFAPCSQVRVLGTSESMRALRGACTWSALFCEHATFCFTALIFVKI